MVVTKIIILTEPSRPSTPRWSDIDGRKAGCLGSTALGFFLYRQIVLHRLHAGHLPSGPRRLGTGHQARHFAAQRDHARIGLGMDTRILQRGVFRDLRIDPVS